MTTGPWSALLGTTIFSTPFSTLACRWKHEAISSKSTCPDNELSACYRIENALCATGIATQVLLPGSAKTCCLQVSTCLNRSI